MTFKEAIDIIGHYDVNFYYTSGKHEGEEIPANKLMDAFDMAIRSLKAWCSVVDALMHIDKPALFDDGYEGGVYDGVTLAIRTINKHLLEAEK